MAIQIARPNSFHLLLSNDELALLRLLAEREGLTASDYLRTSLRRLAGSAPHIMYGARTQELLGAATFAKAVERFRDAENPPRSSKKPRITKKRRRA